MAAGMRDELAVITGVAADLKLRTRLGAAAFHRRECTAVLRPQSLAVVRLQVGFKAGDDFGEADHRRGSGKISKPSISALIRSSACCGVSVARWV
jgi:hypothetical protein